MTVKELIEQLQKIENKDRIVIMSKDAEGNDYSPLYDLSEKSYKAETTWYGEVSPEFLTDEMKDEGWTDEDIKGGEPALVLGPVN